MTSPAVATLLEGVMDGLAGQPQDAMTGRILDAAMAELLDVGVRHFGVEDVARRAGINRITIYRRFAGRDDLLRAVIVREGRRLLADVDAAVAAVDGADEQIAEGFAAALTAARSHPLVRRLLEREPEVMSVMAAHGAAVLALAREYLAFQARRTLSRRQLAAVDVDVVAELAVRLSLSFLVTPESCAQLDTHEQARAFALSYLVPALGSLPAGESAP